MTFHCVQLVAFYLSYQVDSVSEQNMKLLYALRIRNTLGSASCFLSVLIRKGDGKSEMWGMFSCRSHVILQIAEILLIFQRLSNGTLYNDHYNIDVLQNVGEYFCVRGKRECILIMSMPSYFSYFFLERCLSFMLSQASLESQRPGHKFLSFLLCKC